MIADRFTMLEDVEWFDQSLAKLVEEEFGEEYMNMVDIGVDRYFVDFLRDAPEATGMKQSGVTLFILIKNNTEFNDTDVKRSF